MDPRTVRTLGAVLVTCTCVAAGAARAAPGDSDIRLEKLPATVEEFIALRESLPRTPQAGAALFVVALTRYAEDEQAGRGFLAVAVEQDQLVDDPAGYKGRAPSPSVMRFLKDTLRPKPWIARSYVQGATAQNAYALPAGPLVIRLKEQAGDVGESSARIFVYSTGADSARPLRLKKNDKGLWKAAEWSSLCVGVRAPVEQKKDDL